jgi:hypothetical protein
MATGSMVMATLAGAGCDAFGGYPVKAVINAGHHGARLADGKLPDYGSDKEARQFTNDLGWNIVLSEGFAVSTSAKIERCDGDGMALELPFGPFPEYFLDADISVTDFAALDLEPASYCKLIVEYGRYQSDQAAMAKDEPFPVQDRKRLEGATIFLSGAAQKPDGDGGMITVNFGFRSDQTVIVELDLAALDEDGGPWTIHGDEPSARSLTILKTYDQFFTGVDFNAIDQAAIEAELPKRLAANTRVIRGTAIN